MACTVEIVTQIYLLTGYVCVVRAEETPKVSFGLGLVVMLPTATADESQHQKGVALAKELSNADVAQKRASGDKPKRLSQELRKAIMGNVFWIESAW